MCATITPYPFFCYVCLNGASQATRYLAFALMNVTLPYRRNSLRYLASPSLHNTPLDSAPLCQCATPRFSTRPSITFASHLSTPLNFAITLISTTLPYHHLNQRCPTAPIPHVGRLHAAKRHITVTLFFCYPTPQEFRM